MFYFDDFYLLEIIKDIKTIKLYILFNKNSIH